ncbi:hypothetical protein TNCV_409601 [Trichonephila clavipes]|nr:hypothetical protein TNCV_409601 [Trichonephila clavipes]
MCSAFAAGGTLNSRRSVASPLMRLVEGEEEVEGPDHLQYVFPQNWCGTKQNSTVTCTVLKAKANDSVKNLALSCDAFLEP